MDRGGGAVESFGGMCLGHSRFQELDDPGVFRRRISSAERTSDFWTLVGFATLSGLPSHSRCRVCRLRSACHERSRSGPGGVGFERKGTFSAVRSGFSSDLRGGRCKPSHRRCHSKPPPTRQCPVLGRRLSRSSPSNHPVSRNSCPRLLRGTSYAGCDLRKRPLNRCCRCCNFSFGRGGRDWKTWNKSRGRDHAGSARPRRRERDR